MLEGHLPASCFHVANSPRCIIRKAGPAVVLRRKVPGGGAGVWLGARHLLDPNTWTASLPPPDASSILGGRGLHGTEGLFKLHLRNLP